MKYKKGEMGMRVASKGEKKWPNGFALLQWKKLKRKKGGFQKFKRCNELGLLGFFVLTNYKCLMQLPGGFDRSCVRNGVISNEWSSETYFSTEIHGVFLCEIWSGELLLHFYDLRELSFL